MLKNKKMIILFGTILVAILVFINPTKSNAASVTIQEGDNHSTITYTTTINNWNDYYSDKFKEYDARFLDDYTTIQITADFLGDNNMYISSENRWEEVYSGTYNGQPHTVTINSTNSTHAENVNLNFDNGTTVTITRRIDFSGITFNQVGEYDFYAYSRNSSIKEIYEYVFAGKELISYDDVCEKYNCKTYFENGGPTNGNTDIIGKIIVVNELDENNVPTGNLVVSNLYTYDELNGNSKTDVLEDSFTFPQYYLKITVRMEGNFADLDDVATVEMCPDRNEGDVPIINASGNTVVGSFEDAKLHSGDTIYYGIKENKGVLIPRSPYEGVQWCGVWLDNGNLDDYTLELKLNGVKFTNSDTQSDAYGIFAFSSATDDERWIQQLKEDENGNYYADMEFILTRNGSTSYTGISYNILPFAIVIILAGLGIFLMKKTKSKNGGARYE